MYKRMSGLVLLIFMHLVQIKEKIFKIKKVREEYGYIKETGRTTDRQGFIK